MRRELIITVAGTSSRFSESLGKSQVKCIYNEGDHKKSLLYRLVTSYDGFDEITIVGGYKIDELRAFIDIYMDGYKDRLHIVDNPHYRDYGSGYSLYLGLLESFNHDASQIVFAEGDLWVDSESFNKLCSCEKNAITINHELISAKKSVALYVDVKGMLHYIYDTKHGALAIDEPFSAIFNSGQVWKFMDVDRLKGVVSALSEDRINGTNLEIINAYFSGLNEDEYSIIDFKRWINANTVEDYNFAWGE